jgi:D-lactate dehydrogenase
MLASKGLAADADRMAEDLAKALIAVAGDGKGGHLPVVMDASTCTARMRKHLAGRLTVLDFHEFAHDALLPRLRLTPGTAAVAMHVNCSARREGTEAKLRNLVAACAGSVVEPEGVSCCGFGGDRGFAVPELNAHALRHARGSLPGACAEGVSTNRTCEIGLTAHTGRRYRSVAYLLEECSRESGSPGAC